MKTRLLLTIVLASFTAAASASDLADQVKAAGYKGLHADGVANFLYSVKHGADISAGKMWVFDSDIDDRARKADRKFEEVQQLDGYTLYHLQAFAGDDEDVELTIALPSDGSGFMPGQGLRDRCHTYLGRLPFKNEHGDTELVPTFARVDAAVCPGK